MTAKKDPKDLLDRGRPTSYTKAIGVDLCSRIATGMSLRKVCLADDMPCIRTVYGWFQKHPELLPQYAHAKEESGDADQDKLDEIAERVLTDQLCEKKARVAADIIKWSASKKKPKKYGDRIQTEHTGEINVVSTQELDVKLAELIQGD